MHFKAFHYYTFAHTFLTSKYQFWVTNYVEKWCTVTHLNLHVWKFMVVLLGSPRRGDIHMYHEAKNWGIKFSVPAKTIGNIMCRGSSKVGLVHLSYVLYTDILVPFVPKN
ncbi:hypothetical protein PFNF54_02680 [Plasmodium falciparum NF54]|uniref:Uncharacterized protein n=1 Tax=Plasmodium falciparum (isolate NF54) TaxID=5843 RepID=W7JU93_PLAFO|nr:hypothetical protein PFNF54_02680 [Plasmodium falciparum NF54]